MYSMHLNFILQDSYFFSQLLSNSSFDHLECILVKVVQSDILIPILFNLSYLSCLFALTIEAWCIKEKINDIYRLIFVLRKLKYYRMFCFNDDHLITLSLATNNQCSPLERLIINHRCSLNELESLIPYTLELRQLTSHQTDSNITMLQSITLINLMFIYLHMCKISFYELKTFLVNISSALKILSIHCSENIFFLDAHRWEQFISYYYPQLEKFYFTYYDLTDNDNQYEIYPGQINQFSSTFWIERKWIFHVEIDNADIKYIVYPYKKTWYDYIDNKNIEHSTSTSLMLAIDLNPFYLEILFERIRLVLTITQIYHLEIIEEYIVPEC
ncbi:unnamed protein product [Rotaria sp. Silwood1]|nr:unnamed protein product [Rotaria sp. Silwood1]